MKLYATVNGLKDINGKMVAVSKGQGSNRSLWIEVQGENGKLLAIATIYPPNEAVSEVQMTLEQYEGMVIHNPVRKETKGNKYVVINITDKEERAGFSSLKEAKQFAQETNGEIEKGNKQKAT